MSKSPRFPAACDPASSVVNSGGIDPQKIDWTEISGPQVANIGSMRCEPSSSNMAELGLQAPAPTVSETLGSLWARARSPQLRESAKVRHAYGSRLSARGGLWHAPAYTPDTPSLSIRFEVHETGRSLDNGRNFGRHVRSLRRARGMTQEALAERSGLSADTIRRLEHGSFSPSLDTLRKLCSGLDLMLSTLFESYELGARNEARELVDLLASRSPRDLVLATRVLRALFDELDGIVAEASGAEKADKADNNADDGRE